MTQGSSDSGKDDQTGISNEMFNNKFGRNSTVSSTMMDHVEMERDSSPWTELFQAPVVEARSQTSAGYAASHSTESSARAASTVSAHASAASGQERESQPETIRPTRDALSEIFNQ